MKFGSFSFSFGGYPNCIKLKFEGDLTSIMVTRDFFVTAPTTRTFCSHSARKWLWCGWQSWCGWQRLKAGADETYENHDPLPSPGNLQEAKAYLCAWPAKISFNDVCVVPHKMPSPSVVSSRLPESCCGADTVACPAALVYCYSTMVPFRMYGARHHN